MRYRSMFRSAAALAAAATVAVTIGAGAAAQTLTNPNPQPAPSRPPPAAKPRESEHVKPCSAYGAGFVNIPGTGACVKIGGSVTVDSGINRGRRAADRDHGAAPCQTGAMRGRFLIR